VAVKQLLDDLVSGKASLEQTAAAFRRYAWAPAPVWDEAQRWGVADPPPVTPDSFGVVERDSRLTPPQFAVLRQAWQDAVAN
jgi:hypothetical protein